MSSLSIEPVQTQASSSLALMPEEAKQKSSTETLKLTPHQQRKEDAQALAELIYKIYNEYCPVSTKGSVRKENENV
jgi:hypothetical protein